MKIANVKTVIVNAKMRNWVFVKVETSEPGLYGWGEASIEWKTRSVVGAIEDFAPLLIGEDPTRIEYIYQKLYRESFWKLGVIGMTAISGIEQALWDIAGKEVGKPVYKLLGGAARDKARMYTHLGGGNMDAVYKTETENDPQLFVDRALGLIEKGYTALKVLVTPPSEILSRSWELRKAEAAMRTLREGLGDDIDIMIDFHGRQSPANAIEFCNVLAPYRPYFIEEPVRPENVQSLAEVKRAVNVPIATGERLVTRADFRPFFEERACHVIQPDLCHCGGLWEAKKIAAMAEAYDMAVAPHNSLGPIANAVAVHFMISTPNVIIQEDMIGDVPWRWDVVKHDLVWKDGYWYPPEAPGLGIEVDEAEAAKRPFAQEPFFSHAMRAHDGVVLNW